MFNADLRERIDKERKKLEGRLQLLKDALSNPDLDAKLRDEIERKVNKLKMHLETGIHKISNGGI